MALDTAPSDELQSPLPQQPLPSPRGPRLPLFFQPRAQEETTEHLPPSEPASSTETELAAAEDGPAWDSAGDPPSSEHDPSDEGTSSTGSRAGSPGVKLGKAAARATAAKGVIIGSGMLHRMATRAETIQREAGLFLADAEDAEAIGNPLGDIIARRGGVAGKALSPDHADALSAVMGLAGYASKQIALQMQIAQHERAQAGGGAVDV